jgi:protein TonB
MTAAVAPRANVGPWLAGANVGLWLACALVMLALHVSGGLALRVWHVPIGIGSPGANAVIVDLSPFVSPPSDSQEDVAPGPAQEMQSPAPDVAEQKPEEKLEQKVDVPAAPVPPVAAVPLPEPVKPEVQPAPIEVPPAQVATAPPREHVASPAAVKAWHTEIVAQIERHKAYPPAARTRREKGVVRLAFALDRQGRVVSSRVAHASGFADLDQAAMATIERAQPFPPPPADLPGSEFGFTVPVKFSIR